MEGTRQEFEDAVSLVQKLPKDGPYKVIGIETIFLLIYVYMMHRGIYRI